MNRQIATSLTVIVLLVIALGFGWYAVTHNPGIFYQTAPNEEPKTLWQVIFGK